MFYLLHLMSHLLYLKFYLLHSYPAASVPNLHIPPVEHHLVLVHQCSPCPLRVKYSKAHVTHYLPWPPWRSLCRLVHLFQPLSCVPLPPFSTHLLPALFHLSPQPLHFLSFLLLYLRPACCSPYTTCCSASAPVAAIIPPLCCSASPPPFLQP
jgi:hypothetical protein